MIKFRVWCKDKNEWEKHYTLIGQDGNMYQQRFMPIRPDNHIVMEFAGRMDKKGKEEYELDIVKCKTDWNLSWSEMTGVIVRENGEFKIKGKVKDNTDGKLRNFRLSDCWDIEIIGNSLENPELLKEVENEV